MDEFKKLTEDEKVKQILKEQTKTMGEIKNLQTEMTNLLKQIENMKNKIPKV